MTDLNNNGNPYDDATLEEALNQIYDRCTDRTIRQVAYSLAKRIQQGESGSDIDAYTKSETNELLSNKVDKEAGKGLSTEDFTTALLNKLSSIEEHATRVIVDAIVTALSDNPVKSSGIYDFVNSSIATNTAYYIGTFNSIEDLNSYSGELSNNDYAFVVATDEEGNTLYNRYKYVVNEYGNAEWKFEYALNNSSYTAAQWATINSGITATDKQELYSKINDNIDDISDLQITVASKADAKSVYNKATADSRFLGINGTAVKATADGTGANIAKSFAGVKSDIAVNKTTLGTQCKNLLYVDPSQLEFLKSSSSVSNGVITLDNCSLSNYAGYPLGNGFKTEIGKKYTISLNNDCAITGYVYLGDGDRDSDDKSFSNANGYTNIPVNCSYTFTATKVSTVMTIRSLASQKITGVIKPMLRYADIVDDTYEPYQPSLQEQINELTTRVLALEGT